MNQTFSIFLTSLFAISLIQASSILPKPKEIKVEKINVTQPDPEPLAGILFPNGQDLNHPSFLFGLSYIGGAAGQIERRVASSGVVSTRQATEPSQGSIVSAPNSWISGFQFDLSGSSSGLGSNSFTFSYALLTGNSTPTTTTSSGNTPDVLPSFAITNATGATTIVSSVTAQYNLPTFQEAYLTYSRSILINPYLSLMVVSGFHGFALNHKLNVSYQDTSTGVTNLYMKEITYGVGPIIGFTSTKKINDGFALRANLLASAPLSNHALTQSDSYVLNNSTTYGYNVSSTNQLRQHYVGHMDLEAVFRSQFLNGPSMELILSWHVKQYINMSYLTAMSNNQNAPPSTIEVDALKVGLVFIF